MKTSFSVAAFDSSNYTAGGICGAKHVCKHSFIGEWTHLKFFITKCQAAFGRSNEGRETFADGP